MPVIHSRLLFVGLCAALIAGCGGGGTTTGNGTGNGSGNGSGNGNGGGTSTAVTVTFTGSTPTVVAASIGTGAFTAQTLSGSTLTLTIPSGTSNYAVAYLCPTNGGDNLEYVWEVSTADETSPSFNCQTPLGQTGSLTLNLDASAISGAQSFGILSQSAGGVGDSGFIGGGATANNVVISAPVGTDRVLVLAQDSNNYPLAAKNFDNQTVPGALNGGNPVVFTTADATVPETITYSNVPSGYGSPHSLEFPMMGGVVVSSLLNATTSYPMLPSGATEAQDSYFFVASADGTGSNAACNVSAGTSVSGGPVSLPAFPAPWSNCEVPTPAALPTFTVNYTGFSGQTNVLQLVWISWMAGASNTITVEASANYQGGSTALGIPDLSSVVGFLSPPPSGAKVNWSTSINQKSYALTSGTTPLNATWSSAGSAGSFTVP